MNMGLFDIGIRKELTSKKSKEEIFNAIESKIKGYSKETPLLENETLILDKFQSSLLKYDLTIQLEKSNKGFNLAIDGELLQFYVLIFVALIIGGILFTYGIAIIFVVGFAYLQKHLSTKFINALLEELEL